mmetsp:Transcript_101378/g.284210  ORF Transcript_101378/g.284210 Transcript_101378/m.284210 type:complete len:260 (-) Transcript_101378:79-858(-)
MAVSETLANCSELRVSSCWLHMSVFWLQASILWLTMSILVIMIPTCCSRLVLIRLSSVWSSWRRCCSVTVCSSSSFAVMRISKARTSLRCEAVDTSLVACNCGCESDAAIGAALSLASMRCSMASIAACSFVAKPSTDLSKSSPLDRDSWRMVSSDLNFCLNKSSISANLWFCSSFCSIATGIMPGIRKGGIWPPSAASPVLGASPPFLIQYSSPLSKPTSASSTISSFHTLKRRCTALTSSMGSCISAHLSWSNASTS